MKRYIFYGGICLGIILLYQWSEHWEGAEWLFALLTVGVYLIFLRGWKRMGKNGVVLIWITIFSLFMINSMLYLLMPFIFTVLFSLLLGCLLIPLCKGHQDGVLTSWYFVLLNIWIQFEISNDISLWFIMIISGLGVLVGIQFHYSLLRRFLSVIFFLNALVLLFVSFYSESPYLYGSFTLVVILLFVYVIRKKNQRASN